MGKPDKKLKKIVLIMGITGAVYGSFRYLLPLVVPFLFAYIIAWVLRPSAVWIAARCRIRIRGKYRGIPVGIIGIVELVLLLGIILTGTYFGGRKLCAEAGLLVERIPVWVAGLDGWLTGLCREMEQFLCLQPNCLVVLMREMLRDLLISLKNMAMPYLMTNSVTLFRFGIQISVISVILFVAVSLFLQEMEQWKKRCSQSVFSQEFALVGRRLRVVGNAFLKTQGTIMLLTTIICTIGFWILGNPYYILTGIGIGLLDALPIFGTGTVLIPWGIVLLFQRQWWQGMMVLGLYILCYFLREVLEAKMMGDRVGLSPLETLMAMYVGLKLFGLVGFLLGPMGLLLIEDLIKAAEAD